MSWQVPPSVVRKAEGVEDERRAREARRTRRRLDEIEDVRVVEGGNVSYARRRRRPILTTK